MKFLKTISILPLLALNAFGVDHHVHSGAVGSNNGESWNDAYTSIPATLTRGDTYYVADGSYSGYVFDDPESGSSVITIKKATPNEHGSSNGWVDSLGDGQAIFTSGLGFIKDNYVFDGVYRNEADWRDEPAYGFRVKGALTWNTAWYSEVGHNIVVRYCDVGGTPSENFDEAHPTNAFYFGGFGENVTNITVSRCHIHNVDVGFQIAGGDGMLIEYNHIGPTWNKEVIRGQNTAKNIIIRYNIFLNGCQKVVGDPPDGRAGCTAQIGIWDGVAGGFDNNEIYGNVIATEKTDNHSDAALFVGGNFSDLAGPGGDNTKVYNNTIVGIAVGQADIDLNGNNTHAFNNMWYDISASGVGATATFTGSNGEEGSDPFVNYVGNNYRLIAAVAGTALGAGFSAQDIIGTVRGNDGVWDRGAYEFESGGVDVTPPIISSIASLTTDTTATITWTTNEPASSQVNYGLTDSYGSAFGDAGFRTSHNLTITGLSATTTYHYQVVSLDPSLNMSSSSDATFLTKTVVPPDAAIPTFSPSGGSYLESVNVDITTTLNGALIYYTTDGNEPTESSTLYGGTLSLGETTELKAKAFKTGFTPSQTVREYYQFNFFEATSPDVTGTYWHNIRFNERTEPFTIQYDVGVLLTNMDFVMGLSDVIGDDFGDNAVKVRFFTNNVVEAIHGGFNYYTNENVFNYTDTNDYTLYNTIDATNFTYSTVIGLQGNTNLTVIATNYPFATEQPALAEFNYFNMIVDFGIDDIPSAGVSNFVFGLPSAPPVIPPVPIAPATTQNLRIISTSLQ